MERFKRAAAALGIRLPGRSNRRVRYILTVALTATFLPTGHAIAAGTLTSASVQSSDPRPYSAGPPIVAGSVGYTFTGSSVTTGTPAGDIKCIKEVFADAATGATVPAGLDTTGASFDSTNSNYLASWTGWSLNATTNGTLKVTKSSGQSNPTTASARTVIFTGIKNSTSTTAQWVHFDTYNDAGCSSNPVDTVTVQFILTPGSQLSLTVNQSLTFSISGMGSGAGCDGATTNGSSSATALAFNGVTISTNGVLCQDLQASTNATEGYTIYLRYTGPPTNPLAQTIAGHSGSNASPSAFSAAGTEAYGYSTDDASLSTCSGSCNADRFTSPSQGWAAATATNAEIGYEPAGVSTMHYHIGHQIGIASTTNPGTYSTTIIYTCTPVY